MSEANGVPTVSVYLQNKVDEHSANPRLSAMYLVRKARFEADGFGNALVTDIQGPDRLHPPWPYGGSEADSRREHLDVREEIDRIERPDRP